MGFGDAFPQVSLDGGVDLGHERAVRFGRDLQLVAEMLEGHDIGPLAEAQGQIEPAPKLGVRAQTSRGAPGRAEADTGRVAHARIS